MQHNTATRNKLAPNHAAKIPTINANAPDISDCVACSIAGNVITANVTYGT